MDRWLRFCVLVSLSSASCGEKSNTDPSGSAANHTPRTEREQTPPRQAASTGSRAFPTFRLAEGEVALGRQLFADGSDPSPGGVRVGGALPARRWIEVGEAVVRLDGPNDIRIEADPHTQFFVLEAAPLDLGLVRGSLRAVVPPRGGTTPAPVRLATATGTIELVGSGDVLVSAYGPALSRAQALSGRARWIRPGEPAPEGEIRAGQRARFRTGHETETTAGAGQIADARRLSPPEPVTLSESDRARRLSQAIQSLDQILEQGREVAEAEASLGEALQRVGPDEEAADLRSRAVEISRRRIAVRGRLLAHWEVALVAATTEGAERTLLDGRHEQVRSWLVR